MSTALLIFPHQLFQNSPLFQHEGEIYLIEETLFFNKLPFHKQKIAFHRATMRFYKDYLTSKGLTVNYVEAGEEGADVRVLLRELAATGVQEITVIDPVDDWLMRRMSRLCADLSLTLTVLDSPQFLNSRAEVAAYFKPGRKRFFQTDFYKQQRLQRELLLDSSGGPLGGQWSFDADNRQRFPKGKKVVTTHFPAADVYTIEARAYTERHFANNLGVLNDKVTYPIGFEASQAWLDTFLQERFAEFGVYEDAIVHKEVLINHSLLTPMLNVGLLTPQQIIKSTLNYAAEHEIPLNSLEGFVRQITGWREFIRGIYVARGRESRTTNFWGFTKKMPAAFYTATTGILPVDETIQKVLETGYCHHIERLMVLGNFMLLCEIDPDEVYRWFMELFIDAYDWVMVPNVYGMSQFADGGLFATKPYLSGSNYLGKMSDYPKGDWQNTWDALFWRFLDKQRLFFLKNPRLSMLVRTFDKFEPAKKQALLTRAEGFLAELG